MKKQLLIGAFCLVVFALQAQDRFTGQGQNAKQPSHNMLLFNQLNQ